MLDLKTTAAAVLALTMSAGAAIAQNANDEGGPTFPRPGTFGTTETNQSAQPPVSNESTGSIVLTDDLPTRYQAMSPEEQARVRTECGRMEQDKTKYSDSVQSFCKDISAPQ
ncbi:hypothetical protein [Brucella sp. IR073]|uniref:hypothetical protein n=1 Tax=unclassified Brucella TaxID=2632610 RepID=UPI003B986422